MLPVEGGSIIPFFFLKITHRYEFQTAPTFLLHSNLPVITAIHVPFRDN